MIEIPNEILDRRNDYCERRQIRVIDEDGAWGLDAFVWRSAVGTILKVHRYEDRFRREMAAYDRLTERGLKRLQGFRIPELTQYDEELLVLELSFVRPPYILDFTEVGLDQRPPDFQLDDPDWEAEKRRVFGRRWADVRRLLEGLMQYGIYYCDVHNQNIRFDDR